MTHPVAEFPAAPAAGTVPDAAAARRLVAWLARAPRPAGGAAEAAAREAAARWLGAVGFTVREEGARYSALPGRWGTPLAGAALVALIAAAGHLGARGAAGGALAVLVAGGSLVAGLGAWGARRGVLAAPALRREGWNLVATRGRARDGAHTAEPPVWLMAHLDSKSQPVPILVRAAAITLTALVLLAALALAAAQLAGAAGAGWWLPLTILGVAAALPIAATTVGNRSPGALDDASGVAAVLLAAAALPGDVPCGVCLTTAEELGLAGSRAWVARRDGRGLRVLNVDGVDDAGAARAMWSGRRPTALLAALEAAARDGGAPAARPGRLIPGILTDAVSIADAGGEAVTLSRGDARTLLRIHTRRDVAAAIRGEGIAAVAALAAAAAGRLAAGAAEPAASRSAGPRAGDTARPAAP